MNKAESNTNSLKGQKIFGLLMVVAGLIVPFVMNGDITASLLFVPAGIYALAVKHSLSEEEDSDDILENSAEIKEMKRKNLPVA